MRLAKYKSFKQDLKEKNKLYYVIVDFIETILVALFFALLIKEYIIQVSVVPTGSMIPTLIGGVIDKPNDRLFVNKYIYDFSAPNRGDIVVFRSPHQDKKDYVKRCIGLPGETVEIKKGIVFINGKELILNHVDVQNDYDFYPATTIPENSYFVLGDNRGMSQDSRYWGFVRSEDIIGKALFTWWPFNRMRVLK